MRIDLQKSSQVFVGNWNPNILSPNWIGQNVLGLEEGTHQIPVEMTFTPFGGTPPQYTMNGVVFVPARDRLVLHQTESSVASFEKMSDVAGRILGALPHTPIRAIGQNYVFVEENPDERFLEIFDTASVDIAGAVDFPFDTVERAISSSISYNGKILNIKRTLDANGLTIGFNFHNAVDNAAMAAAILPGSVEANLAIVKQVLSSIYGFELDEIIQGGANEDEGQLD